MAAPVVDAEYLRQVDRARRQLRALISNKGCAPIMLRLAYVLRTCGFRFFFFFLLARVWPASGLVGLGPTDPRCSSA
jgi:hypothetical protein